MSRTPETLLDRLGDRVDPLSEILAVLDVRAAEPSRLEAGGRWALRFPGNQHLKLGAILAGQCWVTAEGGEPIHLSAGDCYLLNSGRPYQAGSDPETEPADGVAVFTGIWPDTVYYNTTCDDPDRCIVVGGAVSLDDTVGALLLHSLPPCVRIAADSHRARVLQPILQLLGDETSSESPGSTAMRAQLTQILFVQALRTLLIPGNQPDGRVSGWLGALGDDCIGAALTLIHKQSARRWTVAELATAVGMSRSAFAERFRSLVGLPPMDYLLRWRIHSAARVLRSSDRTVASVATEFGYTSESSFSNAFKRVTGHPPARHRHLTPTSEARPDYVQWPVMWPDVQDAAS
jgi:AraC-like DNA-binding protein